MSISTLRMISNIMFIVSAVFLLTAIILSIVFKLHRLIADVTGLTKRKAITTIRARNRDAGSSVIADTGGSSGRRDKTEAKSDKKSQKTSFMRRSNAETPDIKKSDGTAAMSRSEGTTFMRGGKSEKAKETGNEILPLVDPDIEFTVIEEYAFASSNKLVE